MLTENQIADILQFVAEILREERSTEPVQTEGVNPNTQGDFSSSRPSATELANAPAPAAPVKRRGRPAATPPPATEPAPPEQTTTTAPVEPPAPAAETKPATPAVKGLDHPALVKLITPLIQKMMGPQVKAIINKYAPADYGVSEDNHYTLSKLAEHPEHHAAFVQDIEALSM